MGFHRRWSETKTTTQMTASNPPNRHILIIGGGTAGWMAAVLLAHSWGQKHGTQITLMESRSIGTIGVGEGSTPKMRGFFRRIGVSEQEWMPACNATYKCGISFPGWSQRAGFREYYHPFFTFHDEKFIEPFWHNVALRQAKNRDVHAHPDAFFVSRYLAASRRAPLSSAPDGYETDYAYHFDASLIGQFLKERSMAMGVRHVEDTVTAVNRAENGDIASVDTQANGTLAADLFIDCTGFAGLLIQRTLGVPFISYADYLFNDRAVALPSPPDTDGTLASETRSIAMKHGWAWKIPLTNRFGNGYVYSSRYCDEEQAEAELRDLVGIHDPGVEARHLKMRVGRVTRSWERNCLTVGLAQGFIEPLEATALMTVQQTLEWFIEQYEKDDFTDRGRDQLNDKLNGLFDGIRDYVYMHYKLNTRTDTRYWQDCRQTTLPSDVVKHILGTWDSGGDMIRALNSSGQKLVYSPTSWACILAGMGRFKANPRKVKGTFIDPRVIRQHCEKLLPHFPDHLEVIRRMAAGEPPTAA